MPSVKLGEVLTGFAFCNLCELNASKFSSLDDFTRAAEAATLIGTLQAAYTDMPYLGWVSEVIAEREALLGIGMTGIMDAPEIALNPDYQRQVAERIVELNAEIADEIGIRPAARTTTIKPSGTTALELGCVPSGIHLQHARRFIRRVTANDLESVFQHFKSVNPHMCVRKPNGDWSVEFPVKAKDKALVKRDFTALQFLDIVKSTQLNWVAPGTARPESSPGYVHNVSNTVHVAQHEWPAVIEYLWENKDSFAGVSFIHLDDKVYPFMPFDEVVTEADEARWNQLVAHYRPVNYLEMVEANDNTSFTQEPACAGGSCEIVRA
jgi:ribonucleoside-diphosphate reductase alpha chain